MRSYQVINVGLKFRKKVFKCLFFTFFLGRSTYFQKKMQNTNKNCLKFYISAFRWQLNVLTDEDKIDCFFKMKYHIFIQPVNINISLLFT